MGCCLGTCLGLNAIPALASLPIGLGSVISVLHADVEDRGPSKAQLRVSQIGNPAEYVDKCRNMLQADCMIFASTDVTGHYVSFSTVGTVHLPGGKSIKTLQAVVDTGCSRSLIALSDEQFIRFLEICCVKPYNVEIGRGAGVGIGQSLYVSVSKKLGVPQYSADNYLSTLRADMPELRVVITLQQCKDMIDFAKYSGRSNVSTESLTTLEAYFDEVSAIVGSGGQFTGGTTYRVTLIGSDIIQEQRLALSANKHVALVVREDEVYKLANLGRKERKHLRDCAVLIAQTEGDY